MEPHEQHPLPLLLPPVILKLTGGLSSVRFPIVGVASSGDSFKLSFRPDPRIPAREWDILPESRDFALKLRQLLQQLIHDGAEPGTIVIDVDADGWPVAKPRRLVPLKRNCSHNNATATEPSRVFCDLRHSFRLAIWNTSGLLNIGHVAEFLAEAMAHFKHQRDVRAVEVYDGGPYCKMVTEGRKILGATQISSPDQEGMASVLWVEAVIDAYVKADTVEQMLEAFPSWQKTVEREGGYLREVVGMLSEPGGDLLALAAMIKHKPIT